MLKNVVLFMLENYHGSISPGDPANIAEGDNFLSMIVPEIEASQAYKNDGAIILWWDETEGGDDASHTIGEIVISPDAKGNAYTNNILYSHSSALRTVEEITASDHASAVLAVLTMSLTCSNPVLSRRQPFRNLRRFRSVPLGSGLLLMIRARRKRAQG